VLKILCKAAPNESIVVTDADTAQGMALVRVALELSLEIFASVSKEHEPQFRNTFSKVRQLRSQFGSNHLGCIFLPASGGLLRLTQDT